MERYNKAFYESQMDESRISAKEVLPILFSTLQLVPKSVIDVGCGTGSWLTEFLASGVEEILGVDGDYVDRNMLQFPPEFFVPHDLSKSLPNELIKRYDLAVSLEVAEHIPFEVAEDFVHQLTTLSDYILFSAAVPYQGGTGHVNEQWPEYWAAYFKAHGYVAVDVFRSKLWDNQNVCWWYRQNLLLFVHENQIESLNINQNLSTDSLSLVHPELYLWACARGSTKREREYPADLKNLHYLQSNKNTYKVKSESLKRYSEEFEMHYFSTKASALLSKTLKLLNIAIKRS